MKKIKLLRMFTFALLMGVTVSLASSCSSDEKSANVGVGVVSGTVLDEMGNPLADVILTISDVEGSATTGADGKYTFPNVSMSRHSMTFTKTGYQTTIATITASKFNQTNQATIDIFMVNASGKITGLISDDKNNGAPLAGVEVKVGSLSTTSGSNGIYLMENLAIDDYDVVFTLNDYVTITKKVKKSDFIANVATVNIRMGGVELLRGLTASDLQDADKWYYNEYRGGGNADSYPHWDWACNYMCSNTYWGAWQEQWEGTTLQIRNATDQQSNPADLNVFDSYTYGSKLITADNKILSLRIRTHNADAASPAHFGVQVVDLSAITAAAVKVGGDKTYGSGDYTDFEFDLSAYVGKEVVIAIGIYRKETGDYYKQLVLRAIRFAHQKTENWDWLPGTEIIADMKMTKEMVRSTMPHLKRSFTGISSMKADRDVDMATGYPAAYRTWRGDVPHVAYGWSFMPLFKDPEVTPNEGYIIKTRGNGAVNTLVPESYFYAKFDIVAGSNQFTLKTRNYGSNYTFFKITAFKEDGSFAALSPSSNTAIEASAAGDGCWKFKHVNGSKDSPNDYASFVYDLSPYNGESVLLAIGVHNGEMNGDENKLVLYGIELK